jgi:DNA-binding transcriptional LysR family regulator
MELLDLKIFCELIELKSFTEAARRNFLTQSAVSQRINRLNKYYGNKIFIDKKHLKLYSSTEEIIGQKGVKDIVSIGFSTNAKARYFNKEFVDLILHKNILPEVYFGPSQSIYEKVLFGTLDYGVVGMPQEQVSNDLIFNELFTEKIVLATDHTNPSGHIQLEKISIILDHRDSGLYMFLKNELALHGRDIEELNIVGYVGTSDEKLSVLPNNKHYCFLPESYIKKGTNLRVVHLAFDLKRTFYEIYQKKRTAKISFISDVIKNHNKLLK